MAAWTRVRAMQMVRNSQILGIFFPFVSGVQNSIMIRHLDSGHILITVEPIEFPNDLNVKCGKKIEK